MMIIIIIIMIIVIVIIVKEYLTKRYISISIILSSNTTSYHNAPAFLPAVL